MEMAVRLMETAETVMETDGDGSEGTSPSRQGAGTETSDPRNLSSMAAELRNCSGKNADSPLGFSVPRLYIGEGASSGGCQGALTRRGHGQGLGRAALLCGALVAPLRLLFGSLEASVNFWTFGFCFILFREYFLCSFSETQK
jgi:hypothetical protein